jgi:hypothetical protein
MLVTPGFQQQQPFLVILQETAADNKYNGKYSQNIQESTTSSVTEGIITNLDGLNEAQTHRRASKR